MNNRIISTQSGIHLIASTITIIAATALTACGPDYTPGNDFQPVDTEEPESDLELFDAGSSFDRCSLDSDCVDLLPDDSGCVVALCDFGFCGLRQQPPGHPCNDGNAQTVSDLCQEDGTCRGTVASCGDGKCDLERENCWMCPTDCDCGPGMICYDSKCVATPEDGDGVCEKLEDCGTSPNDCKCPSGQGCVDGNCMDCADACGQDHRECGQFVGCDCGDCTGGLECGYDGICAVPGTCGDGECLAAFENCENCPADCLCQDGYGCTDGNCRSCRTICKGLECGFVDGCDCGRTGICEDCVDGVLKTDCSCICAAAGRDCGKSGDCICGKYDGGCMDRMACVEGLCMPDCEEVCDDFMCGGVGNCLCGRCGENQLCYNGRCQAVTFEEDLYEPDDYIGQAAFLGEFDDGDGTPEWDVVATMLKPEDRDWYTFTVADTWGEILFLQVILDGMSEDADLNLMVCYRCENGSLRDPGLSGYDDAFETASTIENARCFESRRKWGQPETISMSPVCGIGFDDSGTVWIKVFPAEKADARTDYLLGFFL